MIRKVVLGLVSAVALIASANAADIYRNEGGSLKDAPAYYPVNTWAGFYIGVNGGYGWADERQFKGPLSNGVDATGGFGGGQIGYNWQTGHLVLGIETDIQGSGISQSTTFGGVNSSKAGLDWFGTVRGRIGYDFGRTLVYGTGGFAYGGLDNGAATTGVGSVQSKDTATGYVVGGGLEYKIDRAWSLKGEYQYINLGKNTPTGSNGVVLNPAYQVRDDAYNTVRIGLNYHFGNTYEPLK